MNPGLHPRLTRSVLLQICTAFISLFLISLDARVAQTSEKDTEGKNDSSRYAELLANPHMENAVWLYNLGTLSFRLGKPGEAVAYLERARRLSHFDSDIQTNLVTARRELAKRLGGESSLDPASSLTENLADRVTLDQVRGAIGLFSLMLTFFWLRAYRKTRSIRRSWSVPAGLFAACGLLISLGIYFAVLSASENPAAAALVRSPVRSGPGENFLSVAALDPGVIVRLTGEVQGDAESGGWSQIRFTADQIGWVKRKDLLELSVR